MVATSEQRDSWARDGAFWRTAKLDAVANIQRAKELRAEVQRTRQTLHQKMDELRKELAALRAKSRRQRARS